MSQTEEVMVPEVVEAEEEVALIKQEPLSLDVIAQRGEQALAILNTRMQVLERLKEASFKVTNSEDWVLFQDREGNQFGHLGESGCKKVQEVWGIKIVNKHWPDGTENRSPQLIEEDDGSLTAVLQADVENPWTKGKWEGIRAQKNTNEDFIGRAWIRKGVRRGIKDPILRGDLVSSCITALEAKGTRVAAAMTKVPAEVLEHYGIDLRRCKKGGGFRREPEDKGPASKPGPSSSQFISDKQAKRFWAICASRAEELGGGYDNKIIARSVLQDAGLESTSKIPKGPPYEALCDAAQTWEPPEQPTLDDVA